MKGTPNPHNQYLITREHLAKFAKSDDTTHLLCCHLLNFTYYPFAKCFLVKGIEHAILFGEGFSDLHVVVRHKAVPMGGRTHISRDAATLFPPNNPDERAVYEATPGVRVMPFTLPNWVMDFLFSDGHYFVPGSWNGFYSARLGHPPPKWHLEPPMLGVPVTLVPPTADTPAMLVVETATPPPPLGRVWSPVLSDVRQFPLVNE